MTKHLSNAAIEALLADAGQNFLAAKETASFKVLIRVADEFYDYLSTRSGRAYPSFEDADFVIGSIRSGFDCFFDLYFSSRALANAPEHGAIQGKLDDFTVFKRLYVAKFQLLTAPSVSLQAFFNALLDVWKLKFIFLGFVL